MHQGLRSGKKECNWGTGGGLCTSSTPCSRASLRCQRKYRLTNSQSEAIREAVVLALIAVSVLSHRLRILKSWFFLQWLLCVNEDKAIEHFRKITNPLFSKFTLSISQKFASYLLRDLQTRYQSLNKLVPWLFQNEFRFCMFLLPLFLWAKTNLLSIL